MEDLIKMNLEGVRIEYPSQKPIILLKEEGGERFLPIWIGAFEASAIALELVHYKTPRPMTHDLIISIFDSLKVSVNYIAVTDIINDTFYAVLSLINDNGQEINIDLRPSDAIAISVRCKCPMYASKDVIENASLTISTIEEEVEKFKDFL
ncbi:MAG: bifunctional nuclease family protein, partial [Actinobacteria bacterium]|nr:bifunctional nuclease family protein [Actinomycetota bacterium]